MNVIDKKADESMTQSYQDILCALNLDPERISALQNDPYSTKLAGAIVELRYNNQFAFLDQRGKIAETLKKQFPEDSEPTTTSPIKIAITNDLCLAEHRASQTKFFIGMNRAGFSRENMIPTTLPVFEHFALKHLETFYSVFKGESPDESHNLQPEKIARSGFRIQQLNRIKQTDAFSVRKKFEETYTSQGKLKTLLQTPDLSLTTGYSKVEFLMIETLKRPSKVLEIKVKLTAGIAQKSDVEVFLDGNLNWLQPDETYCFTDLDFYFEDVSSKEDIAILYHHAAQQAQAIHSTLIKGLGL